MTAPPERKTEPGEQSLTAHRPQLRMRGIPVSSLVGQKINNYEVHSLLGQGGMGTVYVAQHPIIGRKVAVKVLHDELARDQKLVGRFINEAKAANAIRHPNIVEILDVGTLSDGMPYIVMELLEGESLAARISRTKRIRVGDAVEFTFQAASALAAAHAAGIVHRDLKPDNLFLIPDPAMPGRERLKVLDFGIAKLQGELSGGSVRTRTGTVMGTPPYMSPEQCRGITAEIDHRTDVYALGIILFEMLCGTPPFAAEGFGDVIMMHLSTPAPSPRLLNPGIPEHLERAILKALSKTREGRFVSMQELQAALSQGPARTISVPGGVAVDAHADTDPREEGNAVGSGAEATGRGRPTTTLSSTAGVMEAQLRAAKTRGRLRVAGVGIVAAAVLVAMMLFGSSANRVAEPLVGASAPPAPEISKAAAEPPALPAQPPAAPAVVAAPTPDAAPAVPIASKATESVDKSREKTSARKKESGRPLASRTTDKGASPPTAAPQAPPPPAKPSEVPAPPPPKPQPLPKPTVKSVEF